MNIGSSVADEQERNPMMMFHGIRHYAVYGRDVGTFGGRDKNPTIKVYDGSCANSPRLTVSGELVEKMHRRLCVIRNDRQLVEAYLLGSIQASANIEHPSNPSVQYAMQRFYAKLNERVA
jgi:hypothetical protein